MNNNLRASTLHKYKGRTVLLISPFEGPWSKVEFDDGRKGIVDARKLTSCTPAERAAWKGTPPE